MLQSIGRARPIALTDGQRFSWLPWGLEHWANTGSPPKPEGRPQGLSRRKKMGISHFFHTWTKLWTSQRTAQQRKTALHSCYSMQDGGNSGSWPCLSFSAPNALPNIVLRKGRDDQTMGWAVLCLRVVVWCWGGGCWSSWSLAGGSHTSAVIYCWHNTWLWLSWDSWYIQPKSILQESNGRPGETVVLDRGTALKHLSSCSKICRWYIVMALGRVMVEICGSEALEIWSSLT